MTASAGASGQASNDLRGKLLRFRVKDGAIAPADENHADFGSGGAYTIPSGNLFPLAAGAPQDRTRPEIYAMGFRNPFRVQVDENDVAYVSDYSPDSIQGVDPEGIFRAAIEQMRPDHESRPVALTERLAEAGITDLAAHLQAGKPLREYLEDVAPLAPATVGETVASS